MRKLLWTFSLNAVHAAVKRKTCQQKEASLKALLVTAGIIGCGLFVPCFHPLLCAEDSEMKKECKKCHGSKIGDWEQSKTMHPPFEQQKCANCHAVKHKEFIAEKEKLCLICHNLTSEKIMSSHGGADVRGSHCTQCHSVHGSDRKGLLKTYVHEPFDAGMCEACHKVNTKKQLELTQTAPELCLSCHDEMKEQEDKKIHEGFQLNTCTDCHNPHTSNEPYQLTKPLTALCLDCHDRDQVAKHPFDVPPSQKVQIDKEKSWLLTERKITCTSCHEPHQSTYDYMLREPLEGGTLCLSCHPNLKERT